MTWLLVEDDSEIRSLVSMMMTVWGENPLPFPDGRTAWAWLDTVENGTYVGDLPELALMDIRMPGYTGDQIAARIRRTDALKNIPIILMTAFSMTESDILTLREQIGIDHLLNKPLPDFNDFKSLLYEVRDQRRLRAAAPPQPVIPASPQETNGGPVNPPAPTVSSATSPVAPPTEPPRPEVVPSAPPAGEKPPASAKSTGKVPILSTLPGHAKTGELLPKPSPAGQSTPGSGKARVPGIPSDSARANEAPPKPPAAPVKPAKPVTKPLAAKGPSIPDTANPASAPKSGVDKTDKGGAEGTTGEGKVDPASPPKKPGLQ